MNNDGKTAVLLIGAFLLFVMLLFSTALFNWPQVRATPTPGTVETAQINSPTVSLEASPSPFTTPTAITPSHTPTQPPTVEPTSTSTSTSTPTTTPTTTPCPQPDIEIEDISLTQINVRQQIELNATSNQTNIEYIWNADLGTIEANSAKATYTAANEEGTATITVTVTNACGASGSAQIKLEIVIPPSPTITATPEPSLPKPIIISLDLLPGGALTICWTWGGTLADDQSFAVRFWQVEDPRPEARFSITWTRETCYQFSVDNSRYPQGDYNLNVAVMQGPSNGDHSELIRSENRPVNIPHIQPTLPPPPPPGG